MPATYLNTSTFSEAITTDVNTFTVASTTNITVGDLLVAKGEAMQVRQIPVSGRVVVRRGYQGTRALAHVSGTRFFIGSPDKFKSIWDNATAIVGDNGTLPDFCLPGVRATDNAGNEYVMVDLTATIYAGATVVISHDGNYTASVLASGAQGSVGLTMEQGTSDQWVWCQIYGYNAHAKLVGGSSLATSTGALQPATSVSTPSVGLLAQTTSQASSVTHGQIYGMHLASAATTASTSATSETGLYAAVWLNYPFVMRQITS